MAIKVDGLEADGLVVNSDGFVVETDGLVVEADVLVVVVEVATGSNHFLYHRHLSTPLVMTGYSKVGVE